MKEKLIELNAWNQTFFCIIFLSSLISCFSIYICVNFLVQSLFEMFERKILVESLFCRKIFCSLLSKEEKNISKISEIFSKFVEAFSCQVSNEILNNLSALWMERLEKELESFCVPVWRVFHCKNSFYLLQFAKVPETLRCDFTVNLHIMA